MLSARAFCASYQLTLRFALQWLVDSIELAKYIQFYQIDEVEQEPLTKSVTARLSATTAHLC